MNRLMVATLCAVMVFSIGILAVWAQDAAVSTDGRYWPRWGGRNDCRMFSDAKGVPDTLPAKPTWEVMVGGYFSCPAVDNGVVIVGGTSRALAKLEGENERLGYDVKAEGSLIWALDAATGKCLWRLARDQIRWDPGLSGGHGTMAGYGTSSTAIIEGNRVYTVTCNGEVVCLDIKGLADGNDGPFKDEARFMAPVPKGENDPVRPIAIRKDIDADIIWVFAIHANIPICPDDAWCSSPVIHDGLLYIGTSNSCGKPQKKEDVRKDALHLWDPKANGGKGKYNGSKMDQAAYPDSPSLIALDIRTGRLVAKDDEKIARNLMEGQWSSPSVGLVNGKALIFYGGCDGFCYAFEPADPSRKGEEVQILKKVWSCDANPPEYRVTEDGKEIGYDGDGPPKKGLHIKGGGPSMIIGTPSFHNGRVYVTIGHDTVHGKGDGALTCIDAATGKVIWRCKEVNRSCATPAIVDGLVFVGDFTGSLLCIDDATGKVLWSQRTGGKLIDSPVVMDGKVFFERRVMACAREKKELGRFPGAPYPGGNMLVVKRPNSVRGYEWGCLAYETYGSPKLDRPAKSGTISGLGPMVVPNAGDWGVRFRGLLTPPADGEYAFRAEADTGVRVKIRNKLVIDGWAKDAPRTGKVVLTKGKPVSLVVEYFFDRGKGGEEAALRLFWTAPGGQEAPVPVVGGKSDGKWRTVNGAWRMA